MELYREDELDWREKFPGARVKVLHSERMTVTLWEFEPETDLPEHSHPHEQISMVREGRITLTVDGESRTLLPGDMLVIPPDSLHSARSESRTQVMDVFSPVREDFK
jgi:quercetin dioxygenase-like cupin family protein